VRTHDKDRVLAELTSRVVDDISRRGGNAVEDTVSESVYQETQRLRGHDGDEAQFWSRVRHDMKHANERALVSALRRVVDYYGHEICGTFDERVYQAVTRAGEPMLGMLLNAVSPKKVLAPLLAPLINGKGEPSLPRFDDNIVLQGEISALEGVRKRGTVILVPTHVSHLDSIAVGYALWKLGLPPFLYGAGLNLFSNPMLGFFMRNLGAYTVDRRKRDPLYKQVLKEYCTLTLENDYDNIFFPGGTRSRSGALERKLKLGLLGCGVAAYVHNLQRKREHERIYIIPATLSFQLVLEAETLIDDFLKEQGKARYIITDDEFSKPRRVYEFLKHLLSLDSKIYFTLGAPLDPFGNAVDHQGESIDACGRHIDPSRYVMRGGVPVMDDQRDAEFTREVGERVTEAYARDTVVQPTHVTAHALLKLLRAQNPQTDLMRLLRGEGRVEDIELRALYAEVTRVLAELEGLAARGGVRLQPTVARAAAQRDGEDVVAEGLRHFAIYHLRRAAYRRGDRVASQDRALLFYYANRLEGYRLSRSEGQRAALTPDHRLIAKGA
jgi:glycerol-3-phosphate O-acyltransferase